MHEAERRRATIDVAADEQAIDVWWTLADGASREALLPVVRRVLARVEPKYRVEPAPGADRGARAAFVVRRGLGRGMDISLWLEGPMLRMRVEASARLEMAWGLAALTAGAIAWIAGSIAFCAGLSPHRVATRYSWIAGAVLGVAVALLVGLVTWFPLRIATRRGRQESFEDARRLVDELASAIETSCELE